ncbi:MAG TPA: hypothetical protein VFR23_23230 [Jiangellaceae bacterium]|nr:hypothetical protein [Jiangellaceae bacterium]
MTDEIWTHLAAVAQLRVDADAHSLVLDIDNAMWGKRTLHERVSVDGHAGNDRSLRASRLE